jgi:hypothetical protein
LDAYSVHSCLHPDFLYIIFWKFKILFSKNLHIRLHGAQAPKRFSAREASNLSEVRFGDVAVLKQFSVLHRINSSKFVKILCISFGPAISCAYSPGYIQTFISWTLFDLSNRNPLKIRPLSAVLFWQISANICVHRFIPFFLRSFDHGTFGEVDTVVYTLYVVVLSWNLKQKGLIQCYAYTNVANRFVFSFVW